MHRHCCRLVAPVGSSVSALYQKLYIQSKSAPEDGRMSPEICRADLKRLISGKVVAYCWLLTSLFLIYSSLYFGLYHRLPLFSHRLFKYSVAVKFWPATMLNSRFLPHIPHFQRRSLSETSSPQVGHERTYKASYTKSPNSQQCQKPELQLTKLNEHGTSWQSKIRLEDFLYRIQNFLSTFASRKSTVNVELHKSIMRRRRNGICRGLE